MEKYKIYHPLEMMERILTNRIVAEDKISYEVKEKDDAYIAEFVLPGFSQSDLNIEVSDNVLIVEAKMENGILKLRVPKRKESVSKKIEIL